MNSNRRESIFGISGLNNADRVTNKRQSMMINPSTKRQSLAPNMNTINRRETIMNDVQSLNQMKSSRPSIILKTITGKEARKEVNKEVINDNIKFLMEFFMNHNCSQYASAQILKNPSNKQVEDIVNCMLGTLDTSLTLQGQYAENFPSILKGLGYPISIAKSSISSPNAPHSWKIALAALRWVGELVLYRDLVEESFSQNTQLSSDDIRFYKYLGDSYQAFLSANDDYCTQLKDELIKDYENKKNELLQEINVATVQNETIKENTEQLRKNPPKLLDLTKTKEGLSRDNFNIKTRIDAFEKNKNKQELKLSNVNTQLSNEQNQLNVIIKDKKDIIERFNTQGITVIELESIMNTIQKFNNDIKSSSQKYEECKILETQINKDILAKIEQLKQLVTTYNNQGISLRFIPSTAPLANNVNYALEVLPDQLQQGIILNQDPYQLKPLLKDIQKEVSSKSIEIGKRKNVQDDQYKRKETKYNEIKQDINNKQQIIESNKKEFESKNSQLCNDLSSLQIESKTLDESEIVYKQQVQTMIQTNENLRLSIQTTKDNYINNKSYTQEQEKKDQQSFQNTLSYLHKHVDRINILSQNLSKFAKEKQADAL